MSGERTTRGALLAAALGGLTPACSAHPATGTPAGDVTQVTIDRTIPEGRRAVVLVVDDEATAQAATIRATTKAALRTTLEKEFSGGLPYLDTDWLRADLRVVVVHPSIAGSSGAEGPGDDPGLAVVSENASLADIDAMADVAARAIDSVIAPADATYAPIDAALRTLGLLQHARPPTDARESALLASLGTPESVDVLVATSRDDGAGGEVNGPAWAPGGSPPIDVLVVATPLAADSDGCADTLEPRTRLGEWAAAMRSRVAVIDVVDPSCPQAAATLQASGLLDAVDVDVYPTCLPSPPVVGSDGGAACVVHVTIPDDAPCATYPGMVDSPAVWDAGGPGRVCEIEGLPSPQVEGCSASPSCPDCGPGWCITTFDPLCPFGMFRFVHGAVPRGRGALHIVCDLEG